MKRLFWWRVRWLVNKYLHYLNEKADWESRYVVETDEDRQKQILSRAMYDRKMRNIRWSLLGNYALPEHEWIPIGDGRDIYIAVSGIRVRGLDERDAGKD